MRACVCACVHVCACVLCVCVCARARVFNWMFVAATEQDAEKQYVRAGLNSEREKDLGQRVVDGSNKKRHSLMSVVVKEPLRRSGWLDR